MPAPQSSGEQARSGIQSQNDLKKNTGSRVKPGMTKLGLWVVLITAIQPCKGEGITGRKPDCQNPADDIQGGIRH